MVAQESMTAAEYNNLPINRKKRQPAKSGSKFLNKKVIIDDIEFDSIKEGEGYKDLKLRKHAGDIYDFKHHVDFVLLDEVKTKIRKYEERVYEADFVIYDKDGNIVEVLDYKARAKGKKVKKRNPTTTSLYTLKRHLFYLRYGIEIIEK